jgi:hypothetical protein
VTYLTCNRRIVASPLMGGYFNSYTALPFRGYSQGMNSATPVGAKLTPAMTAVGAFLVFGACMSGLAGVTLVCRGTTLDRVWALNPTAYRKLATFSGTAGPLFLLLSATMAFACVGWFKRRFWGWALAVGIISTQVAGDSINLVRGDFVRGGTGLAIAGALLLYLLRPKVRTTFHSHSVGSTKR